MHREYGPRGSQTVPRPLSIVQARPGQGGMVYNTITLIESSCSEREVHLANVRLVNTWKGNERYIFKQSNTKLGG